MPLPQTDHYLRFTRVDEVHDTAHGFRALLHGEELHVDVIAPDVVRVTMTRGGVLDPSPTSALCVDPLAGTPELTVEREDGLVRLRTSALVLTLWLDPFRWSVARTDGSSVVETFQDEDGRYWPYATLNDAFVVRRRCGAADAIYGLGEKSGRHNRRGRDFTLWNTDVLNPTASGEFTADRAPDDPRSDATSVEFDPYYVSIPFFYHQTAATGAMAASFLDNPYRCEYDFARPEEYRIHCWGGQYTEYVFAGPAMPRILEAYTDLTGRAGLPPLWALGYQQSRWHTYDQQDVEDLARQHREAGIPCDALWLDIEHMDGYRVFSWDAERFPDVPGMLGRLADEGVRVVTIVDPGVKHEPGAAMFDEAVERGLLCRTEGGDLYVGQVWPGDTVFPDFVKPEAREWWGALNAAHVRSGVAGIWNDMNEPATGRIDPGAMRFGGGAYSHERFHNQYALLMAMATHAGLLDAEPDRRPFILSRGGSAGIQRYAAHWMGDNMSRWDHLWLSMPMAMGFGLSGQPFVGADIGGFFGSSNGELFVRWMQYGVLTPFARNHSAIGNLDQYAWSFGSLVQELVRDAIRLRYRLLPYLYAAFVTATETGAPVQRPLIFDHQDDVTVRDIDDEYLLGTDLLVAPVVSAGMTARQVYLPAGEWFDWHSDAPVAGRSFHVAPTPMDRIPIFARAGAVIPMWPEVPPSTAGYRPSTIELHLFVPQQDGRTVSFLQEDDGVTAAARDGAHVRTTIEVTRSGARLSVVASVTGDGFDGHGREAFDLVLHGASAGTVRLDGVAVPGDGGRFRLPNDGGAFTVELDV